MFEKRRCHFTHIFELFARYIYVIVIATLTFAFNAVGSIVSDEDLVNDVKKATGTVMSADLLAVLVVVGILLALSAVMLLYCTFKWRYTFVSAEENTLIYESGRFIKKRVAIPFEKINTIDMGRNIFERLVGTCRLKIDTGAYSERQERNNAEMNLVFSLAEAEEIRSFILCRAETDARADEAENGPSPVASREPDWVIKAGMSDFVLYGLTSSSVWKLFWVLVAGVFFVMEIAQGYIAMALDAAAPYIEMAGDFLSRTNVAVVILGMVLMLLIMTLVSDLFTVVWAAIRFADFRVAREGRNVIVRYGLFTVKNYTLQVRNIHALIIRQNALQQLLGRCSVEAVCMGFGDEKTETALLLPIISTDRLNELLGVILPEYVTEMNVHPKNKAGIYFHIIRPMLRRIVLCTAVCAAFFCIDGLDRFAVPVVTVSFFVLLGGLASSLLSYRNTAIDWNEKVVSVQSGGLRKATYRIRTDAVQEVQLKANIVKKHFGIGTYYVHFHGPKLNNTSVSGNISDRYFEELAAAVED